MGRRNREKTRELREKLGMPTYYELQMPWKAAETESDRRRAASARSDSVRDTLLAEIARRNRSPPSPGTAPSFGVVEAVISQPRRTPVDPPDAPSEASQ